MRNTRVIALSWLYKNVLNGFGMKVILLESL